ncbi:SLC35A4 upstream open reading frame protein isoform X1 [Oncorhynchus mykiss]|uniref:SLC35A4 upstream open reading frame protein isoform X1 n=1 Tax=Oncorhynchus mykiss TaxID=8022 RepID=UPI001878B590|nr:SLC35A4 upstream open reading frame protein isoform X1 [Oncorhynchus mykiss]
MFGPNSDQTKSEPNIDVHHKRLQSPRGVTPGEQLPLKDLAELKDQLEDIQRRVEKEVQAGIPQGGSVLASPFLKGFLAGYIVSRLRSSAVLGVILGTCTGIFAAQNFGVPNIEQTLKDFFNTLKGPGK